MNGKHGWDKAIKGRLGTRPAPRGGNRTVLTPHREISNDILGNVKRRSRGRYVWNPIVQRSVVQLEAGIAEAPV